MSNALRYLFFALLHPRVWRFTGVGIATNIINLGIYKTLMYADVWYWYANVIAFIPSFVFSFWFQKHWAFENKNKERAHEQLKEFFFKTMVLMAADFTLLPLFVDGLSIWPFPAKVVVIGILAPISYLWNGKTFRHH